MSVSTLLVGSLGALDDTQVGRWLDLGEGRDVVVLPTAAAFTAPSEAARRLISALDGTGATIEVLMVLDRTASGDEHVAQRIRRADVVVLTDGSALHARSVWRETALGDALREARCLVAVGSTATVLGEVMFDPRGGAPPAGLGSRPGVVVGVDASAEQLRRTRSLLGDDVAFAVLGARGVLTHDGTTWRCEGDDVVVTRGLEPGEL